MDATEHSVEEVASILSEVYVDCILHTGREFGTITAALSTSAEMDEFIHAGRVRYSEIYLEALGRFVSLPEEGQVIMLGVIGAAEAIAREVSAGRLERAQAVEKISRIMLAAIAA